MRTSLALATIGPADSTSLLREAIDLAAGPLVDGSDYEWVAEHRDHLGGQILQAHLDLAAQLAATDSLQAIMVLHRALDLDPYAESCYRQLIDLHAMRRERDAIVSLRRSAVQAFAAVDGTCDEVLADADRWLRQLPERERAQILRARHA